MRWVVLALFFAMPLLGLLAAWQAVVLGSGRPSLVDKRLANLKPDAFLTARTQYMYLCAIAALAFFAVPVASFLLGWGYPIWSSVFTMICACISIWGWLLAQRYKP